MWSAAHLAPLLSVKKDLLKQVQLWKFDSRTVKPGDLFVAIKGEKSDGHTFLKEVQKKGALAALIDDDYEGEDIKDLTLIRVPSVIETLHFLAKKLIEIWKPKVIGVTGSIGKTSTKEFIYTLIEPYKDVQKAIGNHNSQLTLPLTILNTRRSSEYLLLEMGMDTPGELDRLLDIAPPNYSILTYLAHVHIEAFESFKQLALEKLKIFERKKTQLAIYPLEMPFSELAQKTGKAKKITTSLKDPSADYFLKASNNKLSFYYLQAKKFEFTFPLKDPKSALNLSHAIALAHSIGVSFDQIEKRLPKIHYPEKRMEFQKHKGIFFLNDAYNACVDSVGNALETLPKAKGKRVAVLSEMVEQGKFSKDNHTKLAELALEKVDLLIGYGKEMEVMVPLCRKSGKKWAFFLSYPHLFAYFSNCLSPGDVVLIKGARKHALERLIHDFMAY